MAHVFVGQEHAGETQELAADCARMLAKQFPNNRPRTLFPDRGPGSYHSRWGTTTADFSEAVSRNDLELWAGSSVTRGPRAQPGDVADILPHETANGWLRGRLDRSAALVPELWAETPAEFARRLADCAKDLNATCDVDGLCRGFPKRLCELKKAKGGRLRY